MPNTTKEKAMHTLGPHDRPRRCHNISEAEEEANARLIAAAPDLLAACEALEQSICRFIQECPGYVFNGDDLALRAARAAIAKARGQG